MKRASKTFSESQEHVAGHTPGIPLELNGKISAMAVSAKLQNQSFEPRQNDTCI